MKSIVNEQSKNTDYTNRKMIYIRYDGYVILHTYRLMKTRPKLVQTLAHTHTHPQYAILDNSIFDAW